jgi:MerR family copper efflux transcriptional regulator
VSAPIPMTTPPADAAATADDVALLRIGQLARESGFTPKTLRYYEDVGLLRPAARAGNGYRLYTDESLLRLRFVRRAKGLGLSLIDIRTILQISDEGRLPCEHVMAIVHRDIERIDAQVRRLNDLRRDLLALKSRMADAIASGAASTGGGCPCFEDEPVGKGEEVL